MKNKKIKTIMLIVILMLIVTSIFMGIKIIKKQERVIFEINDITANANEEITINIKMMEDANFVAGNFELLYDSDKMEYVKHEKGEILEQGAMSIVNNDESNDKVLIAFVGDPQNKTNSIQKGELINITFKIKDTVNNTKIMPQFKCSTLKEKEGNDVEYSINQGTITVK